MRRIIASQGGGNSDADLADAAVKRLQRVLANEGRRDPRQVGLAAQTIVAESPQTWSQAQQAAAIAYIDSLAEPQRTIFFNRHKGMKPSEIARSMGLGLRPVLKSLSKIYADLLHI